jgi:hypothetical protein
VLRASEPGLRVHPVLGKWLYLSARHPDFERIADRIACRIADGDPLIGVVPMGRTAGGRGRARSRLDLAEGGR